MADSATLFALSFCICSGEGLPERSVKRKAEFISFWESLKCSAKRVPSFLGPIHWGLLSAVICLSRMRLARWSSDVPLM